MTPHPAAADIVALYQRHADKWDADRGKTLLERPWLDRFRQALAPGRPVLDLGCGTGDPMARYLIEQGHAIVGVDAAPAFIDICRRRFPAQRWIPADMRTLVLNERFGGILAWGSFFHLTPDDQRPMFSTFARHAAPGAALMFTSGPEAGERIGAYHGDALYHASLAPAEYEALLTANGFRVLSYVAEDPACGDATVWLAKFKDA
ncbi:MAG: class I SAM-dependent methyltransferase [Rhodospirillaceae bacterium]